MLAWHGLARSGLLVMVGALAIGCAGDDGGSADQESESGASGVTSGVDSGSDSNASSGFTTAPATSSDPSDGGSTGGAGDDEGEPEPDDEGGNESSSSGDPACDDQTPVQLFLSPDDSNSMSSPVQVRDAVLGGWASIHAAPVRTWEFLNYYRFDYPAAPAGELLVTPSLYRDDTMEPGEYLLQIGVSSEIVEPAERAPMNITLVLDRSGSMSGHPMDMLKETCKAILGSLRSGDIVSMVTWDTSNNVVLSGHAVSGPNDATVLSQVNALEAGGGTDLHSGLVQGYALASQHFANDRLNRIVLISDGGANTGVTDIDIIAEHAGGNGEDGIYMVGVGVGTADTYHDTLMDDVTDAGKGASVFVNNPEEAQRIFGADFVSTMAVAARDVQVQLDLPPGFEILRFSGEEFSSNPEEVEPQHIAPNDAMVFHQKLGTCAPELVDDAATVGVTLRYKDAITFEARELAVEVPFAELLAQMDAQLFKGAAVFEFAEALKQYKKAATAEAETEALQPALAALARAEEVLPGDPDLAEIRSILEAL